MSNQDPLEKSKTDYLLDRIITFVGDETLGVNEIARGMNLPVSRVHYALHSDKNTQLTQNEYRKWSKRPSLDFLFDTEEKMEAMQELVTYGTSQDIKEHIDAAERAIKLWKGRRDYWHTIMLNRLMGSEE